MSQATARILSLPLRHPSENSSAQCLRGWTIPKFTVELWLRGIPYSATARKARMLFPPPAAARPSIQQASLQAIAAALTQLHAMVSQQQPSWAWLRLQSQPPPPTVTMPGSLTINPVHFIPANIRKGIFGGQGCELLPLFRSLTCPRTSPTPGGMSSGHKVQRSQA